MSVWQLCNARLHVTVAAIAIEGLSRSSVEKMLSSEKSNEHHGVSSQRTSVDSLASPFPLAE